MSKMFYMETHHEVNLFVCHSLKNNYIRGEKLQFNILKRKQFYKTFMSGVEYRGMTFKDLFRLNPIY